MLLDGRLWPSYSLKGTQVGSKESGLLLGVPTEYCRQGFWGILSRGSVSI